jgi:hypothetical protein
MKETTYKYTKYKNLINWPEEDRKYTNTGEGGMAIYFIIPSLSYTVRRNVTCTGKIFLPVWSVTLSPIWLQRKMDSLFYREMKRNYEQWYEVDFAMLIGSTKKSFWDDKKGQYFIANEKHLTEDGKKLFAFIKDMYNKKPTIVTLLDT